MHLMYVLNNIYLSLDLYIYIYDYMIVIFKSYIDCIFVLFIFRMTSPDALTTHWNQWLIVQASTQSIKLFVARTKTMPNVWMQQRMHRRPFQIVLRSMRSKDLHRRVLPGSSSSKSLKYPEYLLNFAILTDNRMVNPIHVKFDFRHNSTLSSKRMVLNPFIQNLVSDLAICTSAYHQLMQIRHEFRWNYPYIRRCTWHMRIICKFNVREIDRSYHCHEQVQSCTLPYHPVNISIQPATLKRKCRNLSHATSTPEQNVYQGCQ